MSRRSPLAGTPLASYQAQLAAAERRYRLPRGLLAAIAGAESSFGRVNSGAHNAWGWGPGIDFPDWKTAINTVAKGLRQNYFNEGRTTISAIGAKWAPQGASNDPTNLNSNWVQNVKKFMSELGGSMPPGGAVSPSPALGTPPASSGTPDLTGLAMSNLSEIAAGKPADPFKGLDALVANVSAGAQSPGPAQSSPAGPVAASPGLRPGGGWGGSKNIAYQLTKTLGLSSVSEKRDTKATASGGVSDHWIGSKTAYARDMGGSVSAMDRAAQRLARNLGVSYRKGQPLVATITRNGYRIQILYRTMIGGNHFDHIHVGVRRL